MLKRKKKTPPLQGRIEEEQLTHQSRRTSCLLGCLIIIAILVIALVLGTYLILRPHPEPPLEAFLTANTYGAFILNLDLNSAPLSSLTQKWIRTHTSENDNQAQKRYEGFKSSINFFFYPRVYFLLLDTGRPDSLSTVCVVNFRRAQILFQLLIAKTLRKLSSSIIEQTNLTKNLSQFFLKNSWLITDDYSTLSIIKAKRSKVDINTSSILQEFAKSVKRTFSPEELIIGCVDNSNNWLGKLINVWHSRETPTSDTNYSNWWYDIITEFLLQNEWQNLPWKTINKILISGKLLSADTLLLQFEVFITNPQLSELIRTTLRENILPELKKLLMDDWNVKYSTTINESKLTITLELQQIRSPQ
ncbi:MAG: hypothetical protein N2246_06510 [Candidatus Sumerlaeia bacterium]|nr:hypothetical protein [Candidatus Sumerlaeia bacterium]